MADLTTIRARHYPSDDTVACWRCRGTWPCDTAVVLDELDGMRSEFEFELRVSLGAIKDFQEASSKLGTAEADAAALAEALLKLHGMTHGYGKCLPTCYVVPVLAAHDERVKR